MSDPFEHITNLAGDLSGLGNFWFGVFFLISTSIYYAVGAVRDLSDTMPVLHRVPIIGRIARDKFPTELFVPDEDKEGNT